MQGTSLDVKRKLLDDGFQLALSVMQLEPAPNNFLFTPSCREGASRTCTQILFCLSVMFMTQGLALPVPVFFSGLGLPAASVFITWWLGSR